MQDQVGNLQALGVDAEYLSSTQTEAQKQVVWSKLSAGAADLRLLYVTPELVKTDRQADVWVTITS